MLCFRFSEAIAEARAFHQMTGHFFDREEMRKVERFVRDLESFRGSTLRSHTWESPHPIKTRISPGEYEIDGRGARIYGTMSAIWDIRKIDNGNNFELHDRASTVMKLYRENDEPIGTWNMDVATSPTAPGPHIHNQIAGWATAIPRLPGLAISPFSAFEFLLSDLFQTQWQLRSDRANGNVNWRRIQLRRMNVLLGWAAREVALGGLTPWVHYKVGKLAPNAFCLPTIN